MSAQCQDGFPVSEHSGRRTPGVKETTVIGCSVVLSKGGFTQRAKKVKGLEHKSCVEQLKELGSLKLKETEGRPSC